jgi:hypothetical protein
MAKNFIRLRRQQLECNHYMIVRKEELFLFHAAKGRAVLQPSRRISTKFFTEWQRVAYSRIALRLRLLTLIETDSYHMTADRITLRRWRSVLTMVTRWKVVLGSIWSSRACYDSRGWSYCRRW